MSGRIVARLVWVVVALALAATAYGLWSELSEMPNEPLAYVIDAVAWTLLPLIFILSGSLIVSRQPRNIIGLLLMIPGLIILAAGVIDAAAGSLGQGIPAEGLTAGLWLRLWFDNWSWVLLIFPIFHLMLVFPTGRLLSPRWGWVVGLEAGMVLFMLPAVAFGEVIGPLDVPEAEAWTVPNPIGFLPAEFFGATFNTVWTGGLLFLTAAALAAMILRFRRVAPTEHQ